MSGIDEVGVLLPTCPHCKREDVSYYTVGTGRGGSPLYWLYDSVHSTNESMKQYSKDITEDMIMRQVRYAYCSECDKIMNKSDYGELIERLIDISLITFRRMEHERNR